jgi:hypothetical protein
MATGITAISRIAAQIGTTRRRKKRTPYNVVDKSNTADASNSMPNPPPHSVSPIGPGSETPQYERKSPTAATSSAEYITRHVHSSHVLVPPLTR